MACELFLLSSLWFLLVIFWMETISIWLFLCNFYQNRAFYPWGERVFLADPGHMHHVFSSDGPGRSQISPCSQRRGWGRGAWPPLRGEPGVPGAHGRMEDAWPAASAVPGGGNMPPLPASGKQEGRVVNPCERLAE